jgi:hypothetical protein
LFLQTIHSFTQAVQAAFMLLDTRLRQCGFALILFGTRYKTVPAVLQLL